MVVALRQAHNHAVMAGESLRHRAVSASTRQLFQTMFAAGMTPAQALELHRSNLYAEHGDSYQQVTSTVTQYLDCSLIRLLCITITKFLLDIKKAITARAQF